MNGSPAIRSWGSEHDAWVSCGRIAPRAPCTVASERRSRAGTDRQRLCSDPRAPDERDGVRRQLCVRGRAREFSQRDHGEGLHGRRRRLQGRPTLRPWRGQGQSDRQPDRGQAAGPGHGRPRQPYGSAPRFVLARALQHRMDQAGLRPVGARASGQPDEDHGRLRRRERGDVRATLLRQPGYGRPRRRWLSLLARRQHRVRWSVRSMP